MKKIFCLLLLTGLAFGSFAQHEDAMKFAETITKEELRDNLTILASDAMEGRETGERGQKMAAAFIAHHFEQIGLEPVVKVGDSYSYYQKFDLEKSYPGEIYVTLDGNRKNNGEDLIYWGRKNMANEETIQAVFLGKGEDAAFTDVDVTGKAVVIYASGSGFQQWSGLSNKAQEANAAITFLIVADDTESYTSLLTQYRRYFMGSSLGFKKKEANTPGGVFLISPEFAAEMFGTTTEKLTKSIEDNEAGKKGALQKLKSKSLTYYLSRASETVGTENVLGFLEGTDRKDEIIVISSHYDHIGKRGDMINNGADDDGSGTTSVLEIAQAFTEAKKAGKGPRRSMLFITVTGEEKGLLGSQYYVENPIFPLENTVVDLNIDMIGRFDPEHEEDREFIYLVGSDRLSTELHELSEKTNETFTGLSLDYTYNDEKHPDRIYYRSDHWNFAKNGIPIIFYFSGIHEDYHKPTDTVDKIEFDLLKKRADLVFYTAWIISNRDDRIVVDKLQDTTIDRTN